jgi:hypothetical protein
MFILLHNRKTSHGLMGSKRVEGQLKECEEKVTKKRHDVSLPRVEKLTIGNHITTRITSSPDSFSSINGTICTLCIDIYKNRIQGSTNLWESP